VTAVDGEGAAPNHRRLSFWRAVALACAVVPLLPPSPTAMDRLAVVGIPVGVYLLAFQWRRPMSLALGVAAIVALLAGTVADPSAGAAQWRAWGLLIGGGFVVATALGRDQGLFIRALVGVVIAAAVVAVAGVVRPEILTNLDGRIISQYNQFFFLVEFGLGEVESAQGVVAAMRTVTVAVYPALVGLASMGALCIASYVATRMEGVEAALAPLRGFRFGDHFAWWMVVGLVLLVVPAGGWAMRLGGNIVMFMGGLYAFRGLAVLAWLGTTVVTSGWWIAVWMVAAILFYPVTLGTALVMGLTDTWLDLRSGLGVEADTK